MKHDERSEQASKLVDRFADMVRSRPGLIPVPVVDLVAVAGLQLQMLRRISQIYEVPFTENRGKALITSLLGAAIPTSSGLGMADALKAIPVIGTTHLGICDAGACRRRHLRHRQGVHPTLRLGWKLCSISILRTTRSSSRARRTCGLSDRLPDASHPAPAHIPTRPRERRRPVLDLHRRVPANEGRAVPLKRDGCETGETQPHARSDHVYFYLRSHGLLRQSLAA